MDRTSPLVVTVAAFRWATTCSWIVAVASIVVFETTRAAPAIISMFLMMTLFVLVCLSTFARNEFWRSVSRTTQRFVIISQAATLINFLSVILMLLMQDGDPVGPLYGIWVATYLVVFPGVIVAPALVVRAFLHSLSRRSR